MKCSTLLSQIVLILGSVVCSTAVGTQRVSSHGKVVLVHDYKRQDNQLIDVSSDGALILTEKRKICAQQDLNSFREFCSILVVYETSSGRQVGELELDRIQNGLAGFTNNKQVILFDYKTGSASQWDLVSTN